jgi:hypothetical protein
MPILLRLRNLGNEKRKIFVFGAIGVAGRAKIITLSYVKILSFTVFNPSFKNTVRSREVKWYSARQSPVIIH